MGASLQFTHLLVATGRVPNTDTLNLETIGLFTDKRGYIETNGQLVGSSSLCAW